MSTYFFEPGQMAKFLGQFGEQRADDLMRIFGKDAERVGPCAVKLLRGAELRPPGEPREEVTVVHDVSQIEFDPNGDRVVLTRKP